MNLVQPALRRPLTVVVLIVGVALGALLALRQMPRDIFPTLGMPTIYVAQPYGGMDPAQMEGLPHQLLRVPLPLHHRHPSRRVEEHPGHGPDEAVLPPRHEHGPGDGRDDQLREPRAGLHAAGHGVAVRDALRHRQRAGRLPRALERDAHASARSRTWRLNRVRPMFATPARASRRRRPSAAARARIVVSVDPDRLRAYDMSPDEVVTALDGGNTISPSGQPAASATSIRSCRSTRWCTNIKDLETVPIRTGAYPPVFVRDVGHGRGRLRHRHRLRAGQRPARRLHPGHQAGRRLDARRGQPRQGRTCRRCRPCCPTTCKVSFEFDQSPYVTRAIAGLALEGALGALLTGLMVLLFLRDWRSALDRRAEHPARAAGRRGRAVAHRADDQPDDAGRAGAGDRHPGGRGDGRDREHPHPPRAGHARRPRGRGLGQREAAVPRLAGHALHPGGVHPVVLHAGRGPGAVRAAVAGRRLLDDRLLPAVEHASCRCSRVWLLRGHRADGRTRRPRHGGGSRASRRGYGRVARARRALRAGWSWPAYLAAARSWSSGSSAARLGHGDLPAGRRRPVPAAAARARRHAASTARRPIALQALDIDQAGGRRRQRGRSRSATSACTRRATRSTAIYQWTGGPEEAVLQVRSSRGAPVGIEALKERLRAAVRRASCRTCAFSFEPADIVNEVMSFGSPTPIEVAVSGPNLADEPRLRREGPRASSRRSRRCATCSSASRSTTRRVDVDGRPRAGRAAWASRRPTSSRSLVAATSSSRFVVPNYWADPKTGIGYQVQVEIPQPADELAGGRRRTSRSAHRDGQAGPAAQRRDASRAGTRRGQYDRYNMQRMVSMTANIAGRGPRAAAPRRSRAALSALGAPPAAGERRGPRPDRADAADARRPAHRPRCSPSS